MGNVITRAETVSVDRIFLDLGNPRHEQCKSQEDVIDYLCREESVYAMARDIVKHGLNPLETFALIPLSPTKGARATYFVAEGNRRMCALMLLNDPDLAPAAQRKKLAEEWEPASEVLGVIFEDRDAVSIWLERIHGGELGGIGRKSWSPEQKSRHIGDTKNALAQIILDYAEKHSFISVEDRKGKLTTVQRYLGNAIMREVFGIDSANIEEILRNRPREDFNLLLKRFLTDLVSGTVNSRADSKKIIEYSRGLSETKGISGKRITPEPLADEKPSGRSKAKKASPTKPEKPTRLPYEDDIHEKLKAIPSYKLERLYYSLCSIDLESHTSLLCVGVWAFLESLTAKAGRNSQTPFLDYLTPSRLNSMGFTIKDDVKTLRQAIERVAQYGNTTKHHRDSANFNGDQLANDMEILREVIRKLADEAKEEPKKGAA